LICFGVPPIFKSFEDISEVALSGSFT
jgi:hypothetical protein